MLYKTLNILGNFIFLSILYCNPSVVTFKISILQQHLGACWFKGTHFFYKLVRSFDLKPAQILLTYFPCFICNSTNF